MLALSLAVAFAVAPPSTTAPLSAPQAALAIHVDRIVQPDGTLGAGGWILIRGGRLEAVGAAAAPAGVATLEIPGGVAAPGFIDPVTSLGAAGDLSEPARAFTPEVNGGDAFRAADLDFLRAARGGITTVGVAPGTTNLVDGVVAIVRTHGDRGGAQLGGSGPMRLTLTDDAFDPSRVPTSRMGALPKLRQLTQADSEVLGRGPVLLVDAESPDQVRIALETLGPSGHLIALMRPRQSDDTLALLHGKNALAVLGPFDLDTSERELGFLGALTDAGTGVAFTAAGHPGALRLTAALAVRAGMKPERAMQSLTTIPARILGVEGDSATLEAGKRGDVVVFDGDPLDLSSRVKLVLIGGTVVELRSDVDSGSARDDHSGRAHP